MTNLSSSFRSENICRRERILYLLLSFLLPLFIILAALAGLQITPFGDHTLVISDANGYYINTLSYAARMYKGLEGLTYSFEKTIGGNMIGHLNGILTTPFTFLLCLTSVENYPTVFTFISALNFSLCGLTMYLFLADVYGDKRSNLIFSTSYALMGFNVANVFQAVFFGAAPMLPVMALGLKKLFDGKKPLLYFFSIAFTTLIDAYFGFVLCVASFLFFLVHFIIHREDLQPRKEQIAADYILSSLCAGLFAAVLWLPSILSIKGGRLDQDASSAVSLWENMPFQEMGAKLFTGANSTDELINGLPNIFIGIIPLALAVLFFMNRKIDRRKKTEAAMLLGFYLLAFYTSFFNLLMHGGTTPNWFNYRYSFVFSFIMLVIAACEWQYLDASDATDLRRCILGMLAFTLIVFTKKYAFAKAGWMLLDYALLTFAGFALFMHRKDPVKNPQKTLEMIVLFLACINLFMNYRVCTKNIQEWEHKLSDFQETVQSVNPLVQGIQAEDPGFFRMEINEQRAERTGNDPMLYGYNGVGHGGSNERDFVRTGLSKLGIPWYSNRSFYADGVPAATDTLLGIKYVIAEENLSEEKDYLNTTNFDELEHFKDQKNYDLYYNEDTLSLAVLSGESIRDIKIDSANVFDNLNRVWASLSGLKTPLFVEETEISFTPHSFIDPGSLTAAEAREITEKYDRRASESSKSEKDSKPEESENSINEPPEFQSYIEYTFTADQDGPVFVYNRAALSDQNGSPVPTVNYLGTYQAGDSVTGYITINSNSIDRVLMEEYSGRFRIAYADTNALHEASEIVKSRPVTIDVPKDNHLLGHFFAEEDQVLLFTIPWDDGWTCYVDGQKTDLVKVLDLFMAVQVSPGKHSFEMKFVPEGLRLGIIISVVALVLMRAYLLVGRKLLDKIVSKTKVKEESRISETTTSAADNEMVEKQKEVASNDSV